MNLQRNPLTYRSALVLSIGISLLVNLLYIIIFAYGRSAFMPSDTAPPSHNEKALLRLFINFASVFVFSFVIYLINFKILKSSISQTTKIIAIIIGSLVATFVLSYILSVLQTEIIHNKHPHYKMIRGGFLRDFFIANVVVFSSLLMYVSHRKQLGDIEYKSLQAENVKTRYHALRNQMDPHFLFNSLNTLNSIIKTDQDKAQQYVQQLSQVFRYTLQNKEVMPLVEELKFTKAYCSLMQIRYGVSLGFVFDVDEKYDSYNVIPLSVQTLVENAIKHNVITAKNPLTIDIYTTEEDMLVVSNPIRLKKEAEPGEGIGLANLAERYRLMWQKEIVIESNNETFKVTIPLQRS